MRRDLVSDKTFEGETAFRLAGLRVLWWIQTTDYCIIRQAEYWTADWLFASLFTVSSGSQVPTYLVAEGL